MCSFPFWSVNIRGGNREEGLFSLPQCLRRALRFCALNSLFKTFPLRTAVCSQFFFFFSFHSNLQTIYYPLFTPRVFRRVYQCGEKRRHLHTQPVSSLCFAQVVALPAERVRFFPHHRNTVPHFCSQICSFQYSDSVDLDATTDGGLFSSIQLVAMFFNGIFLSPVAPPGL